MMTNSEKGYLLAFLTALCWSSSGVIVKALNIPTILMTGIQSIGSLTVLLIILKGKVKITSFVILTGICQLLMHLSFVEANKIVPVGNVIALQYSSMIFVLLLESIEKKKLPKPYQWIVIFMSLSGITVIFHNSFSDTGFVGNLLALISGIFFALQFYLNSKKQADPDSSIIVQYLLAIIMMFYVFIKDKPVIQAPDFLAANLSGFIQLCLAGIFFARCIKLISPFSANLICMSEVIMSPLWAFVFLKEKINVTTLCGAGLIIIALVFNAIMEYRN